jgi:hypothetical protein
MSSLDEHDLFGSGPHAFRLGAWERARARRGFAGLDGELVLDLGLRSRVITQAGRLQASSPAAMQTLLAQIDSRNDGRTHVLIDNHGRTYSRVILERFEPTTPLRAGRSCWCDYEIHYRQLP